MRHLSRSAFERFSAELLTLSTFPDTEGNGFPTLASRDGLVPSQGQERVNGMATPTVSRSESLSRIRQMAPALRPHLRQALGRARRVLQLIDESVRWDAALEAIGLAAIRLDADGKMLDRDTRATKLLSDYCSKNAGDALPEIVAQCVRQSCPQRRSDDENGGLQRVMVLESDRGELIVSLLRSADDLWLVLRECRTETQLARLRASGLTVREAEVLGWIVKGKTNDEAAGLLGAQPATIKKHLKAIYVKWGVDSRVAALSHAKALLGHVPPFMAPGQLPAE